MNIVEVIKSLQTEQQMLAQAIASLQQLNMGKPRRGRPPKSLIPEVDNGARKFSAKARRNMAAAQRKRWAAYHKEQK